MGFTWCLQFENTAKVLEKLKTWDTLFYYGDRVLTGDLRKLVVDFKKIETNNLEAGTSIALKWIRNPYYSFLLALLKKDLGTLKLKKEKYHIKTDDYIIFHKVGDKKVTKIQLCDIDKLVIG